MIDGAYCPHIPFGKDLTHNVAGAALSIHAAIAASRGNTELGALASVAWSTCIPLDIFATTPLHSCIMRLQSDFASEATCVITLVGVVCT